METTFWQTFNQDEVLLIGLSKNIPTGSVDLHVLDLVRVVVGEGFNLATSSRVHRLID